MKTNIFKIPPYNLGALKEKFKAVEMSLIDDSYIDEWNLKFYLSENPEIVDIPWVKDFEDILHDREIENKVYYGTYLCTKRDYIFAISYGKAHFYIRNFCDTDFGLDMAKKIVDENQIRQTSSKRFSGKKKKEIKSYKNNTKLNNESGESLEFLSANIIESKVPFYGKSSKFGASFSVSREDLSKETIPQLLDEIVSTLENDVELFGLPKTLKVTRKSSITTYDNELLDKILGNSEDVDTVSSSHDMVGVDFVFGGNERHSLRYNGRESDVYENLDLGILRQFISDHLIDRENIFSIKVKIIKEDGKSHMCKLKEYLDYIIDEQKVILQNGNWIEFNENYVDQINESVDSIDIEETEKSLLEIRTTETDFNNFVTQFGYTKDDKNFGKIKIGDKSKVEAWDLRKGDTVYAVKFGNAQKLVYVCNQAMNTLEIIRNKANLKKIPNSPKEYCLWFAFDNVKMPEKLSQVNSIILRQSIDAWARKCRDVGIMPKIKISKKLDTTA